MNKELQKEYIMILLEAAKLGKEAGGLTTNEVIELMNKVGSLIQADRQRQRENLIEEIQEKINLSIHGHDGRIMVLIKVNGVLDSLRGEKGSK